MVKEIVERVPPYPHGGSSPFGHQSWAALLYVSNVSLSTLKGLVWVIVINGQVWDSAVSTLEESSYSHEVNFPNWKNVSQPLCADHVYGLQAVGSEK